MRKVIPFTRLKTVKSNDFELTREIFYNRLKEHMSLSNSDVISYDKENDTYNVIFDGNTCEIYYGNEVLHSDCKDNSIIEELNGLIEYQTLQKELNKKKEKHEADVTNAIDNGKLGIFKNDNDKVIFIKYLKKDLNELKQKYENYPFLDKENGVSTFMDIFDNSGDFVSAYVFFRVMILLIIMVILLVGFVIGAVPLSILAASLFFTGLAGINCTSDRAISIILPIILLTKYLIARKKRKNKIKEKIDELIKRITPLEKSLSDPTLLLKEEVFKVEEKDKEVSQETYETIKNMIYQLRDRIVLVEDHNKKNKFGNELTQIIDFERMINKNNKSINPQDILNQLKRLSYQVEKEINEKNVMKFNNRTCDEVVEECNKVISYHK